MISAQVTVFDRFPELGDDVDQLCLHALNQAAQVAAGTALGAVTGLTFALLR